MPYVNQRWLGGMLTNFQTVFKRLQRLKELEAREQAGWEGVATKKEQLMLTREKTKLERSLGGIREMTKVPSAVWIVDTKKEHIAVGEARKLSIPVVAILDTNCDPDEVDYKIPGNDDAIRSAALLTRVVADAVAEGLVSARRAGRQRRPRREARAGRGPAGRRRADARVGAQPAPARGQRRRRERPPSPAAEAARPPTAAPAAEAAPRPPRPHAAAEPAASRPAAVGLTTESSTETTRTDTELRWRTFPPQM